MELSGLIFVALALVWAVVLIPKALKHHDEVAQTRPVEESSEDARVLVTAAARDEVRVPRQRTAPPPVRQPASPVTPQVPAPRIPAPRTPVDELRRAAADAAGRRRRVLMVLLLTDLLVGLGAAFVLPLWAPAIPVAITAGFLVLARVLVRGEQARWERAVSSRRTATSGDEATSYVSSLPATPFFPEPTAPAAPAAPETSAASVAPALPIAAAAVRNHQGLEVVSGLDDTASFPVGLLASLDEPRRDSTLWDPVPVTLPTYVTKPRADRSIRTIDLTAGDVTSSGRAVADPALAAETATSPSEAGYVRRVVGG